jgi:glycine C-acetyltransferase
MADLESKLKEASSARRRLIVTDGIFSMDGYLAPLEAICDLADRYDAMVMVDDSHAVGFMGPPAPARPSTQEWRTGSTSTPAPSARPWAEPPAGMSRPRREIVAVLRQRARPYLFSNSLAPSIVAATLTPWTSSKRAPSCAPPWSRTRRTSAAA